MAIRNYIMNNKKKSTCIATALLLIVVAVFGVVYVKNANAGVFVKDENGDRVQTNEINVLEIVAQYGQQVLGYTVKGQEPITKEKIESYKGTMDIDIEDFKDATGFILEKKENGDGTFSYKVKDSVLSDTFNKNVLGDSMAAGEITVNAVQANELTLKDIAAANLIFINSNDYNENLLYYYDQIMQDGKLGYAEGEKGANYTDTYYSEELKTSVSLKRICSAAGNKLIAYSLTEEEFERAGLMNYEAARFKGYQAALAGAEKEKLNGDNDDERLNNVEDFLVETNRALDKEALNYINENIITKTTTEEMTAEDKDMFGYYLLAGGWSNFIKENLEQYCEKFVSYTTSINRTTVQITIEQVNTVSAETAAAQIIACKNKIVAGESLTAEEYNGVKSNFYKINSGEIKELLVGDYITVLFGEEFQFSDQENTATVLSELYEIIDTVNKEMQEKVRKELADAAGDAEKTADFKVTAADKFIIADIDGYEKYNVDDYVKALEQITDTEAFKSLGTSEAGYDIEKIKTFIKDINTNSTKMTVENSYDMTWQSAMGIYEYAMIKEKALMYNTELLTNSIIGDYTKDLSVSSSDEDITVNTMDNTNNLYKLLLLTRQIQYPYYRDNLAANIDENGMYYPQGKDTEGNYIGDGINSWYKETFGNDFTNYQKYHEPDVVGKTYAENGTEAAERNYVYKRIYSFTGAQFFGGESFVATNLGADSKPAGVVTPNTGYLDKGLSGVEEADFDKTEGYIFLDAGSATGIYRGNAYVWVWGDGIQGYWEQMEVFDSSANTYVLKVPEGVTGYLFATDKGYSNQSGNFTWAEASGVQCHTVAKSGWWRYNYSQIATESSKFYYAGLTTSMNVEGYTEADVTMPDSSKIVEYKGDLTLDFVGYNITTASYRIGNNGSYGNWTPISTGEQISIGSDLSVGTVTNIQLKYNNNASEEFRSYWYNKTGDTYSVDISNIINGSAVEYYENMDIVMTFRNVTDFKYSIDGGEYITAVSGLNINIGNGVDEGGKTNLSFKYTVDGIEKTVGTTLYKKKQSYGSVDEYANYLSLKTATNADALSYDNTHTVSVNGIITKGNKGDIVRYIMDITLNEYSHLNILEIEPAASTTVLDTLDGKKKIAEYLGIDTNLSESEYDKLFTITYMSVREFNTRNEDLTAKYDLIYMGIDSGYMKVKWYGKQGKEGSFYRTQYNDKSMNGLVYTGIGDEYGIVSFLRGTAAEDYKEVSSNTITNETHKKELGYWKTYFFDGFMNNTNPSWNLDREKTYLLKDSAATTRIGGNDLTVKSKDDLINYLKAGYPILLADEIMYCDSDIYTSATTADDVNNKDVAKKWRYVDLNSKMYAFVQEAKSLGRNSEGVYDGLDGEGNYIFGDKKTYPSLISESYAADGYNPENLDDMHKFEGGLRFALKRITKVEFELVSCPKQYNKNDDGTRISSGNLGNIIEISDNEYRNYTFTLNVNSNVTEEWMIENYEYQLYIDKSGVGKFEKDYLLTLDPTVKYAYDSNGKLIATISGKWPQGMEGFIPWKLEAYNISNPENKFSYTGFSSFANASGEAKDVYVLWVRHQGGNALTLNFKNSITYNKNEVSTAGYNIHLLSMTYREFVDMWKDEADSTVYTSENSKLKVTDTIRYMKSLSTFSTNAGYSTDIPEEKILQKNEQGQDEWVDNPEFVKLEDTELNMLVFGFSDSYNNDTDPLDIDNINALKNIEYFVDSGKSLLFSHDGSSYLSTMNYYVSDGKRVPMASTWYWGRYTTAYMRDMLGMDVYGATYSSSELPESLQNARKYLSSDIKQSDLRGYTETTVFHYTSDGVGNRLYTSNLHSENEMNITNWMYTTKVMKVNEGQITEYPFVLGDSISTATTHTQYMMLDMEDVETTVWYTLDNGDSYYKYTKGDGANNYYIYSNENITYTGAGHSPINDRSNEAQLFINTMIAALKAGNYAPDIQFPYAYNMTGDVNNYVDYYADDPDSKGLAIAFKPVDYDVASGVEGGYTHCRIYIDVDDNGSYTAGTDVLLNDTDTADGYANMSNYIKDINATGNLMINAGKMANRSTISFLITKEDIANIANDVGLETDEEKKEFIYKHKIYVEVTDNGTKKDVNNKATAKNSVTIVKKDYVDPGLMPLN